MQIIKALSVAGMLSAATALPRPHWRHPDKNHDGLDDITGDPMTGPISKWAWTLPRPGHLYIPHMPIANAANTEWEVGLTDPPQNSGNVPNQNDNIDMAATKLNAKSKRDTAEQLQDQETAKTIQAMEEKTMGKGPFAAKSSS